MSRPRIHQDVSQTADQKSEQKKFENKSQSYYAAVKKMSLISYYINVVETKVRKKNAMSLFWSKYDEGNSNFIVNVARKEM